MNAISQKKVMVESVPAPAVNPFFATLASAQSKPKLETPLQKFRGHLRHLEQISEAGDVVGWNQHLPKLSPLAIAAKIAPEKDLRTRVELKKMEMTLLLMAGNKAKAQGEEMKTRAQEALQKKDPQANELLTKAEKLIALRDKLHAQLISKTT
jgi:hypothetical protein